MSTPPLKPPPAGEDGGSAFRSVGGPPPPSLTVRSLLGDPGLGVELLPLAGEAGLDRLIKHARIQKSGLALVGHFHGIVPTRIQILGQTELSFLHRLSGEDRRHYLRGFFKLSLSCVILTQAMTQNDEGSGVGVMPVPELIQCAEEAETPLLLSSDRSSATINALHALLDDRLAPRVRMHGVLVDVFGVGLLLVGPSSIGKSETALDLVMRGHRLVADDAVECDYRPPGMVFGAAAELLRHHLEVRGLGILNIKDLYGVTAIRERKRIDVVVRLVEWSKDTEYDRMGLDDNYHTILGVNIRELVIPVRPGRDMASILEVAARNELLKTAGHHAAREFFGNLEGALLGSERPTDESAVLPPVRYVPPPPSSGAAAPRPRFMVDAPRPEGMRASFAAHETSFTPKPGAVGDGATTRPPPPLPPPRPAADGAFSRPSAPLPPPRPAGEASVTRPSGSLPPRPPLSAGKATPVQRPADSETGTRPPAFGPPSARPKPRSPG